MDQTFKVPWRVGVKPYGGGAMRGAVEAVYEAHQQLGLGPNPSPNSNPNPNPMIISQNECPTCSHGKFEHSPLLGSN